ncbi:MAG: hypothetical protein PHV82_08640, partial [Victivallaceae bacterium]|nr:hypothetical protein [Victivallaceae bacterium]
DDGNSPLDNRAWFSFAVAGNLNVLLLYNQGNRNADPFYFFRLALSPSSAKALNGIRCRTLDVGLADKEILAEQHVVCLALDKPMAAATAALLGNYIRGGGILLTVPGAETREYYCDRLAGQPGLRLRKIMGRIAAVDERGVKFNPPLRELNGLLQLKLVRWRKLFGFKTSPAKTVAVTDTGRPLILEQPAGKGRLLSLAFSLRRDFSNWPTLKSYPVAMVALVNYAAGNQEKSVSAYCGAQVGLKGEKIVFSGTGGQSGALGKEAKAGSTLPGILTFEGADLEAAVFNPSPDESKPAVAAESEIRKWFDAPLTILNVNSEVVPQIVKFRKGSELTGWFLLAMLLLLGFEFLLGTQQTMLRKAVKKAIKPGGEND